MLRTPLRLLSACILALAVAACEDPPTAPAPEPAPVPPTPTSITLSPSKLEMRAGEQATVAAQVLDQNGKVMEGAKPVFHADRSSVIFISPAGVVTAVGDGSASISATYGPLAASVPVTVTPNHRGRPVSVVARPTKLDLFVGDQGVIAARVLDADNHVVPGVTVQFSIDRPSVASVSPSGAITAISPGEATVTASYGALTTPIPLIVAPDTRAFVKTLDILPAEVSLDLRSSVPTYVDFRALNGFGQSICSAVTFSIRSDRSVASATNRATNPGNCILQIDPVSAGETYLTLSANGVSDSVLVKVSNAQHNAFFAVVPEPQEHTAGATVAYAVRVVDASGAPLAGRGVSFEVSSGTLSASRVTTNEEGVAVVQWTLPTSLSQSGSAASIRFRTQLPNDVLDTETRTVSLSPGVLADVQFFKRDPNTWALEPISVSTTIPVNQYHYIEAIAVDRFGNRSTVAPTIGAADPAVIQSQSSYTTTSGHPPMGPNFYNYAVQRAWVRSNVARTVTMSGIVNHTAVRTIEVTFQ